MTSDSELHDLLVRAVDEAPPLDAERLSKRLGQRRRRRQVGRAVGAIGSVVVLVAAVATLLPWLDRDDVQLAGPVAVAAFEGVQGEGVPTLLPEAAVVCPPAEHALGAAEAVTVAAEDPAVTTTWFCAPALDVVLLAGPHASLPETGDVVAVARRDGFVQQESGTISLTVSDDNSLEDVHYRVVASDPVAIQTLVSIMESIPAIEQAPFNEAD
ncbi:hypothetical protein [Euzebya tangerina]|uniref:hypothetical protein n=1 Tax=Euzebya tangerina TaxID=591198 RepID=UPI000E310AE2|nr:hypothetical protein [Euzebya tangerina]